jgi:glycosyltransferase involved in cell wall biosynthesis
VKGERSARRSLPRPRRNCYGAGMRRKRVCVAPLTQGVSGTEKVAADLMKALSSKGVEVSAIVPEGEPRLEAYAASLREITPDVVRVPPLQGRRSRTAAVVAAARAFRSLAPDGVHFHCPSYRWSPEFVMAAKALSIKTIIRTEHNPLMAPPEFPMSTLIQLADRAVQRFTYVSRGNQSRFETLLPSRQGRGQVINNGIDSARFAPRADEAERAAMREEFGFPAHARVAIYLGGFGGRRPLGPIFTAFERLQQLPDSAQAAREWRILVVGSGNLAAELAGHEGIAHLVHHAGQRQDVAALVRCCDLFVSASHFEGLSLSMLECWAAGLPVLTYEVDGVRDVLGELTERETAQHGQMDKYVRLWSELMANHPDRLAAHAKASATVRERFGVDHMIQSYMKLYSEVGLLPASER